MATRKIREKVSADCHQCQFNEEVERKARNSHPKLASSTKNIWPKLQWQNGCRPRKCISIDQMRNISALPVLPETLRPCLQWHLHLVRTSFQLLSFATPLIYTSSAIGNNKRPMVSNDKMLPGKRPNCVVAHFAFGQQNQWPCPFAVV